MIAFDGALHSLLGFALTALASVLLVPIVVLLVELLAARPLDPDALTDAKKDASQRPSIAVLMPAHNEAQGIAAAVGFVMPQLQCHDRLLVVADNCSDDTAAIAERAGAQVLVRTDAARRGKGFALDAGVRHLEADPPGVVIVIDADCIAHAESLDRLARSCAIHQAAAQGLYLMHSPPGAGVKTRIAEFAWCLKNQARPLGALRLGMPCPLFGSGMAFPWPSIHAASLASAHLVEDLQLGLDLALAGQPPRFCPAALVTSVFPTQPEGMASQRTRWEQGQLGVILTRAPRLLWQAVARRRLDLLVVALDMSVPPLSSLALLSLGLGAAAGVLWAVSGNGLPFALASLALALLSCAVLVGWQRFGRNIVTAGELARLPLYMLVKLPMYLSLLRKRQTEWVRTRRDGGTR